MVLFIILGVVVLITFVVLGILFFMLNKETKKEDQEVIPSHEMDQIKKELSSNIFEQNSSRVIEKDSEIIPVFTPQTTLPVQEAQASPEDIAYKKRAQQLEDELLAISKKADGQSDQARQMIEDLTKENETLKAQQANLVEAQQKLAQLQTQADNLKSDNTNLQSQLEATNAKVALLEDQMAAVKVQMGEEVSRANETVIELTREKEALLSAPKIAPDEALKQEAEVLKSENAQLKLKCEYLEKTNQQFQYELVKAKAQASGLERVSFNYKNQLEDFFKKINAVEVNNENLYQVKNRLEGMVEEVKTRNEELMRKDQLAQFELEKNRSRLASLERECEDLKARMQQQGQQ